MAFDLSAASNILKVRYLPPIRKQLNSSKVLMARIQKQAMSVSGKSFTIPLHTNRNKTAGSGRADGGVLPTAGNQAYATAVVPNAYIYTRIQVTGPTMAATRDNAGAFAQAVQSEMEMGTNDMERSVNRQMNGDGRDALAFWTTADDTSGTNVDDSRGNAFTHLHTGTTVCDLIDASDNSTKLGDSIVVTLGAKGSGVYAITWSGSVSGSADTDYLVLEDTLGQQMMGIAGIIYDGNPALLSGGLHGIDATTAANAYWQAQVFGNSGTNRDLDFEKMQEPLDAIASNSDASEKDVEFLLCSYGVRRKYFALAAGERRFVNTLTLDGGFKGLDFDGIPLIADPQCQKNRIYYVVPESMKILRTSDFDWLDDDGAVLSRVANTDAFEATLLHYGNLACFNRNQNALLDDITE